MSNYELVGEWVWYNTGQEEIWDIHPADETTDTNKEIHYVIQKIIKMYNDHGLISDDDIHHFGPNVKMMIKHKVKLPNFN